MDRKNNFNANELPTREYLKEAVDYNEELGILIWKIRPLHHFKNSHGMNSWNARYPGKAICTKSKKGYLSLELDFIRYPAHRVIWKWYHGEEPNIIDHINGIKDDNRIENLRNVTCSENNINLNKLFKNNTSTYNGVSLKNGKYVAKIGFDNAIINIGSYDTLEEAALARELKEIELFGEEFYFQNEKNIILLEELKLKVKEIIASKKPIVKVFNTEGNYIGTYLDKSNNKILSYVDMDKERIYVGYYNTREEAAYFRELKLLEIYGEEKYNNLGRNELRLDLFEKVKLINPEILIPKEKEYVGAYYKKSRNKWISNLTIDKNTMYLGSYKTKEEAALTRELKMLEILGEEEYTKQNRMSLLEELKEKVDVIKQERNYTK
jgi:hypothetical protein